MEETTQKIDSDETQIAEDTPVVEDLQEASPTEAPESPKRKKHVVIGVVAAVAVVAVVGVGAAFALSQQPAPEADEPSAASEPTKTTQTTQASVKKDAKSEVKLSIKAEGVDATATKAKIVVKDAEGKVVVEETEVAGNSEISLGELPKGEYELYIVVVPVIEDGSTFKLPDEPVKFMVDGKGDAVKVESALTKLAKEEMSKEQLEAAASVLTDAGKADAASNVAQAAQAAPSVPGSAESVAKPGSTGNAGGDSSTPATPSTPDPAPSPTPTPTPEPTPTPNPPSPSQPSHICTFEPITTEVWVADGSMVPDYSRPGRVFYCSDCGIDFASENDYFVHMSQTIDAGTPHHGGSRADYPMIPGGWWDPQFVGWNPCPICGATR